jgi:hypothetical protein
MALSSTANIQNLVSYDIIAHPETYPMKMMMNMRYWLIALICTGPLMLGAQEEPTAFSILQTDSLLHVRMTTDMKQLVKNKFKEIDQPATIELFYGDGTTKTYEVTITPRGNRRKDVCILPPIHVRFPKDEFRHSKIKWVLPCGSAEINDQNLLEEYYCYRIFEKFSEASFQTALMKVEFIDLGRKEKSYTRYAFAIEDVDEMAERVGGYEYQPNAISEQALDKDQLALFTMFQYMIANTDWGIVNLHNLKTITDTVKRVLLPVPYDFDYSGFVDAAYAVPNEFCPIDDVIERYNWGKCLPEDAVEKARKIMLASRDEVQVMITESPYLEERYAKQLSAYLDPFYRYLEDPERIKDIFCVNLCRAN